MSQHKSRMLVKSTHKALRRDGGLSPSWASFDAMTEETLLTPAEVAEVLQLNERTVTQWLRKGHLRGFKLEKQWRVSSDDLRAFLEAHANKPKDSPRPALQ